MITENLFNKIWSLNFDSRFHLKIYYNYFYIFILFRIRKCSFQGLHFVVRKKLLIAHMYVSIFY